MGECVFDFCCSDDYNGLQVSVDRVGGVVCVFIRVVFKSYSGSFLIDEVFEFTFPTVGECVFPCSVVELKFKSLRDRAECMVAQDRDMAVGLVLGDKVNFFGGGVSDYLLVSGLVSAGWDCSGWGECVNYDMLVGLMFGESVSFGFLETDFKLDLWLKDAVDDFILTLNNGLY